MDAGCHANRSTRIKFCGETSDRNRSSGKTYRPGYGEMPLLMNKRKEQPLSSGSVGPKSTSKESLLDPVCRPCHGLHGLLCSLVLSSSRLLPRCFRENGSIYQTNPTSPVFSLKNSVDRYTSEDCECRVLARTVTSAHQSGLAPDVRDTDPKNSTVTSSRASSCTR